MLLFSFNSFHKDRKNQLYANSFLFFFVDFLIFIYGYYNFPKILSITQFVSVALFPSQEQTLLPNK